MSRPDETSAFEQFLRASGFDPKRWKHGAIPPGHSGFVGMRYRDHGDKWVELEFDWREDLVGDPETGVIASGPIISLLDNATSMSVWATHKQFLPQVTLDLRIDYTRAAVPHRPIIARAECYQLRRSMAFVRGIAHDGDPDDPVAHAAGVFILVEPQEWAKA
ncbi:phenylacetic acid degradation-related protein [Novosphingobium nitrogenifigens DSM 19370]|uniref:Phenylacetic acid degradation-related protein n=1 Tax=Novosphingobium nitrogenifigens DSM 19370 TaxID=983920 RepID=F1Z6T9_9SPHN|nr:PaaI family thioesterase [Novosphingobium nitrogenifigens]EGD59749.1 phenylacetic acid degradation-related protein [Novosphingobium nitrogenifigens DSM 19370]